MASRAGIVESPAGGEKISPRRGRFCCAPSLFCGQNRPFCKKFFLPIAALRSAQNLDMQSVAARMRVIPPTLTLSGLLKIVKRGWKLRVGGLGWASVAAWGKPRFVSLMTGFACAFAVAPVGGSIMSRFSSCVGRCALAAAVLLVGQVARAANIPINDPSFENYTGSLSQGILGVLLPATSGTFGSWNVSRTGIGTLLSPTAPAMSLEASGFATDGSQIAAVRYLANVAATATFSQTLAVSFQPNTVYQLEADIGTGGLASVLAINSGMRLKAGATTVASGADGTLISLLDLGPDFDRYCIQFTTGAVAPSGNIGIELFGGGLVAAVSGLAFDNVTLTATPVPEPSTIALGAVALAGLGMCVTRRLRRGHV
jgi:hypothetical protein